MNAQYIVGVCWFSRHVVLPSGYGNASSNLIESRMKHRCVLYDADFEADGLFGMQSEKD